MTHEFQHYPGCNHRDTDNCSACALTDTRQDAPNYAAWPLAYMENKRAIPTKWRAAFHAELARTDNIPYVDNIKATMAKHGVRFTDGAPLGKPESTMDRNHVINVFREHVLAALDTACDETFGQLGVVHRNDRGATDGDLNTLFPTIDTQVDRLAARYGVDLNDD